ncbi:hypothetical protein MMO39_12660 [Acinetobacter modestus]|uniref:hypothetical protein n=1 Tax=Acinetobacter modestus TaxID=1776740 RepID=UPI001F4B9A05|nr:hypothetical protein [Acinetobacter modestus]MCH7388143.1 hypothetical protein [Acinetobacter modestus]
MPRSIYLFMWGYQESFRISCRCLIRDVLKELGAEGNAEVFLVGARAPESKNKNEVCIEPEDGKWSLSIFSGLLDSIESIYSTHHLQNIGYGDAASMRDKPKWMRQDSTRRAVEDALKGFDEVNDVMSFCGETQRLGEYYITPVIQIPKSTFIKFPALKHKPKGSRQQGYGYRSFIHAAIFTVLDEVSERLQSPEPGRFTYKAMRSPEEITQIAAKAFLRTPGLSIDERYYEDGLFEQLNLVSSLMYEQMKGVGRLILTHPANEAVDYLIQFIQPVSLREPRWVRKILQMAASGSAIIADWQHIYGLGDLKITHDPSEQDAFTINFLDHYSWELCCGEQVLLRSKYGVPKLPQEYFDQQSFIANYIRLFPLSSVEDSLHLWNLLQVQIKQEYGSMIVVTEDAAIEAKRLSKQGTSIVATRLTETLLQSISSIDGTILLDPYGVCHAFGVILDGEVNEKCTPSRGSRYNSGVRYVYSEGRGALAIVASDDKTIDIIPEIRRLVSRSLLERYVKIFIASTIENFHDSRNWLDKHRFYINAEQCEQLNSTIDRLDNIPKEVGRIYFGIDKFEVHPVFPEVDQYHPEFVF